MRALKRLKEQLKNWREVSGCGFDPSLLSDVAREVRKHGVGAGMPVKKYDASTICLKKCRSRNAVRIYQMFAMFTLYDLGNIFPPSGIHPLSSR